MLLSALMYPLEGMKRANKSVVPSDNSEEIFIGESGRLRMKGKALEHFASSSENG